MAVEKETAPKPKSRPGRKRLGDEPFVPVTMKVEPAELATINTISRYSGRSRSDVMRELLSLGLARMMGSAFGDGEAPTRADAPTSANAPAPTLSGVTVNARKVVSSKLDADTLLVVAALGDGTRGSRSAVVRSALEHGLALAGYQSVADRG